MSRDYQTTVDLLVQRVRQDGGVAVTDNVATEVLGKCERLLNAHLKRVKATTSFTTTGTQLVYDYRSTLTAAIDILEVTESNRTLFKCNTLMDLSAYDIDWFRKIDGTQFEAWCQIARDFFVLYPAKAGASSVNVTYTKLVTVYATYAAASGNNMSLPDEDVETCLALAEIILLAKNRNIAQLTARLNQLVPLLSLHNVASIMEKV
jgi:hypothetical protein